MATSSRSPTEFRNRARRARGDRRIDGRRPAAAAGVARRVQARRRAASRICQTALKDAQQQVEILEKGVLKTFCAETAATMHPDLAFAVWCGERAAAHRGRARPSLTFGAARRRRWSRRCATRCWAAASASARCSPMRPARSADADPAHVDAVGRGRGNDPRLFAGARRPAVHGRRRRCAAASRRATSRSAKPRRCSRATRCRRWRSPPAGPAALRDAGHACALLARCGRRAGHGRRPGDRPRARAGIALSLPELETMHRMKTGALIRAAVRLGAACGRARSRR